MQIRGENILLPLSAISAFPRPHWLQGRILGSLNEPVYRNATIFASLTRMRASSVLVPRRRRVSISSPTALNTMSGKRPASSSNRSSTLSRRILAGFAPYGPPGDGVKYKPFYKAVVKGKVEWVRPMFESVVTAMQGATTKPFKVAFLGPAQQSIIVDDQHYGDPVKLAKDMAVAMNKELKYLVSIGLEAVQLIDVLAPYTQDLWQMEVQDILFDGVDAIKFWHICYGSVDGQRDVFEGKAAKMMSLFKISKADVIHIEFANKGFDELAAFKAFPKDKGARRRRCRRQEYSSRIAGTDRRTHQEGARGGSTGSATGRA